MTYKGKHVQEIRAAGHGAVSKCTLTNTVVLRTRCMTRLAKRMFSPQLSESSGSRRQTANVTYVYSSVKYSQLNACSA